MGDMQFIDLKKQYQLLQGDIQGRIEKVLNHGVYIMGPEVQELEQQLAQYVQAKHCITLASGTDALMIAMMALGIKPGDEVITTPFTFIATAETIRLLGAVPVFVDIDPKTYNIDPAMIEAAITAKTKLIMPVNLYGQCADYDAINQIAAKQGLPVVEDAAQSFGATYKDQYSCNLGTIGCASFFPAKPLGCYGDGGACFTNDDELADKMRKIRNHGQSTRYNHVILGVNSRLDSIQAAILLSKLSVFNEETNARQTAAQLYDAYFEGHVQTPFVETHNRSIYAQYTIQVDDRLEVQNALQARGIPTAVHYPVPLHKQPVFQQGGCRHLDLSISEFLSNRVMSLPFHPYLQEHEIKTIAAAVIETVANKATV
jgi:UDP-2-acetamido-2-deoxy-ribo-hexuluronate aminotransferase